MRIVMVSLMMCALAFLAGVAGDLSLAPPDAAASVHLAIPADAVRAHPLTPSPGAELVRAHRHHYRRRAHHALRSSKPVIGVP